MQTRITHRRPAFLHVLQKPRHERPGSVVVCIRIRRVDRLTVLEHGPDRDRSAESEFEVVPGPEQTRDFVVRNVRCAHDVVDEAEDETAGFVGGAVGTRFDVVVHAEQVLVGVRVETTVLVVVFEVVRVLVDVTVFVVVNATETAVRRERARNLLRIMS